MAYREYIGSRYVPIFGRKGETTTEWDNLAPYEPLTVVTHEGNSYISRQYVPTGIDIDNREYWVESGNYNAQIEAYRQEVLGFDNRITANSDAIAGFNTELEQLKETTRSQLKNANWRETMLNTYFGSFPIDTPASGDEILYMQGSCLVTKNNVDMLYQFASEATNTFAKCFNVDLATGVCNSVTCPSEIIHPNDATYNDELDKIIVISPRVYPDTTYYACVYDYTNNTVVNSYVLPSKLYNITWDKYEKCYYAFIDTNPFTGVIFTKLNTNFNVIEQKTLPIGQNYFNEVTGFSPQCCECDDTFIYLGYAKDDAANLTAPLQGSGVFVLTKDGTLVNQIIGCNENELESLVLYKGHFLTAWNVRRMSSAHNPMIIMHTCLKQPLNASSMMYVLSHDFEGYYPYTVDIAIDRSYQNFFSDGTTAHPLKHINELMAIENRHVTINVNAHGDFLGCGIAFTDFSYIGINGNNGVMQGLMRFDRCGNVTIRNVTYRPSANAALGMASASVLVDHCNAITFNGITFEIPDTFTKTNVMAMYATIFWLVNCIIDTESQRTRYVYLSNSSGTLQNGTLTVDNIVRTGSSAINGSFS